MSLKTRRTAFQPSVRFAAACLLFAVSLTALGCRREVLLEIRDSGSGKLYGSWRIADGGEFSVEFVHSVNQTPVRETFALRGKMIVPLFVRFYSFGAGMQSDLEPGMSMTRDGDALVISAPNRSFGELNYIVGTVSDHLLFINDARVSLRKLCGKNAHITMRAN